MYKRILVPLDGSELAECGLPHAEGLARGCGGGEVILVSVTERAPGYRAVEDRSRPSGQRLIPEATGKKEEAAQKYLSRIGKRLPARGITVSAEVLLGDPAEEIVNYAGHPGCDIIVMSSHGRSGPSRWAHGSVADKVFRASCVPVLVVRAPGCVVGI